MDEQFYIHEVNLSYTREKEELISFLKRNDLKFEDDIETAYGIYDDENMLLGCGCAAGRLLKCFAMDPALRGQNGLGTILTQLIQNRFEKGVYDLMVITRSHNRTLFENCGMHTVVEAAGIVLLENRTNGPERFAQSVLKELDPSLIEEGFGCAVMNCNPFTKGHRYLIEYASAHCKNLLIFVVEEDRSAFPAKDRYALVKEGTEDLNNVHVFQSGPYMISRATFPTYFLKENEDAASLQAQLDISLFAQRLAPALHIHTRFAGEEPLDPVTAGYNNAMAAILPAHDIEFVQIPRLTTSEEIVSASRVRKLLEEEGVSDHVLSLVPECTQNYLKKKYGKDSV